MPATGPGFPLTRWSLILHLREGDAPSAAEALEELCRLYWYPVYAFIRREGSGPEDAEDLTQGFFAMLLARGDFLSAERDKGRLRTFLLACLKHYMVQDWRYRSAAKRGGVEAAGRWLSGARAEERYALEAVDPGAAPDVLFDRRWALDTLEEALRLVEREYAAAGRAELHAALQPFISTRPKGDDLQVIGGRLGMTAGALHVAVHRLRLRFRRSLQGLVAETVGTRGEADAELRHLLGLLSNG